MICVQCQKDRPSDDFLLNSTCCYQCTYKNKLHILKEDKKNKRCKICNNEIPKENLVYWKACYCSDQCAREGKNLYNKNYWIHNCNAPKGVFKFQYGKPK